MARGRCALQIREHNEGERGHFQKSVLFRTWFPEALSVTQKHLIFMFIIISFIDVSNSSSSSFYGSFHQLQLLLLLFTPLLHPLPSFSSPSSPFFSSSFLSDGATVLKSPFHILLLSFLLVLILLGISPPPTSIVKIQQYPELQTFPGLYSSLSPRPLLHHKLLPALDLVDLAHP